MDNEKVPRHIIFRLSASARHTYWATYSYYSVLHLQEESEARNFPGQWSVEYYVNDRLPVTRSFELRSTVLATTAMPTSVMTTMPAATTTAVITVTVLSTLISTVTTTFKEVQQINEQTLFTNPLFLIIIVLVILVVALLISLIRKKKMESYPKRQQSIGSCPNCGAQLRPGSAFCTQCGQRLS